MESSQGVNSNGKADLLYDLFGDLAQLVFTQSMNLARGLVFGQATNLP